jgi:hypothetical protein
LAEAENIAKNLSTALAGLSVKAREVTERVSILAGQLKEISLFLIITREEEAVMTLRNECIIYRLIIPRIRDHAS